MIAAFLTLLKRLTARYGVAISNLIAETLTIRLADISVDNGFIN